MKIAKNSEARLVMRKKKIQNKKCGMRECKVTPKLKSLIARTLSKMAHPSLLSL